MPVAFFGYPSYPTSVSDVMQETARLIRMQGLSVTLWEDLRVGGRLVIQTVLDAIDAADSAIFDLTFLNPNVAFELAYAIARGKPIRIVIDTTVQSSINDFNELSTFKPVGYTAYHNSAELAALLIAERPWKDELTAYDELLEPSLPEVAEARDALLYCPTFDAFEASSRLSSFIDSRGRQGGRLIVADPKESSYEPIVWLAPAIARSAGILVSFAGPLRVRSDVINTRHAIVAGLGYGLGTPILMVAESDYKAPFDFETLLRRYSRGAECVQIAREWLETLRFEGTDWQQPRRRPNNPLSLLRLGEHVAENELDELPDYFVETSAYYSVLDERNTIFVGHRGTGKTANVTQASEKLAANRNNLVVLIKPPAFEFPAMFEAVLGLPSGQRDYFFDSLWRFVVQTEIGSAILSQLAEKGTTVPYTKDEEDFLTFVGSAPFDLRADISTRLEQTLDHLRRSALAESADSSPRRDLINEAFHSAALNQLRAALGHVLKGKKRVAVLVDNLDKGWDKNADFSLMARFILGLLTAMGNVVRDFDRQDWWRNRIRLTVGLFLRSDIYYYLRTEAREPDKLPLATVKWSDPNTLLRVLELRYESKVLGQEGSKLWERVLPATVDGVETQGYILQSIQPRPRDILVFTNAAIASAIDRGSEIVSEEDVKRAHSAYSDYAFDALLVENGVTIPELRNALYAFLGASRVQTRREVEEALLTTGIADDRLDRVIDKLVGMCFFGIETHPDEFVYPEVGNDADRARALAKRVEGDESKQRLRIHDAYHPYLECT